MYRKLHVLRRALRPGDRVGYHRGRRDRVVAGTVVLGVGDGAERLAIVWDGRLIRRGGPSVTDYDRISVDADLVEPDGRLTTSNGPRMVDLLEERPHPDEVTDEPPVDEAASW